MIESIDDKESSNEMTEPSHFLPTPDSRCKNDSDCPKGEICSMIGTLIYDCVKPNGNTKSPKQGIEMKF